MNSTRALVTPSPSRSLPVTSATKLAIVVILLLAGFLRLYDLQWDYNQHLHPDERHIVMVTNDRISLPWPNIQDAHLDDPKRSTLNPRSVDPANGQPRAFAYGSLPLYLLKASGQVVSQWWKPASSYDGLTLVGRVWSALFELGTIALIFLIGRRLYGDRTGLLAALLLSLTVLDIQLGHFYVVDTLLNFFIVATLFLGLKVMEKPSAGRLMALGGTVGLALSCKVSAAPILVACAVACFAGAWSARRKDDTFGDWLTSGATSTSLVVLAALAVFGLFQPYVLLDSQPFIKDIRYESDMVRGVNVLPYTVQYLRTEPVAYHLRNMLLWTAGPALGITALVSLIPFAVRLLRQRRKEELLLAAWLVPYVGITFTFQVKFARYLLPALPVLVLLAAALLARLASRREGVPRWQAIAATALPILVVGVSALQAVAFLSIYQGDHTRVRASQWIYANIPPGTAIATEHWDDSLPLRLPESASKHASYVNVSLQLYDSETPQKRQDLIKSLSRAQYIAISSNRLYGSIPRVPEMYPVASTYYSLLFQGSLGFERVAEFTSYPSIGPLEFVDDSADESFTVYDHPKVMIYKKTADYSEEKVRGLLEAVPLGNVASAKQVQSGKNRLLLSAEAQAVQESAGTWSQLYDREGFTNRFPTLVWWAVIEIMGILALPFTWRLFRRFPDGGYGVAKTLGLLVVAYVAWLLPSLHLAAFGPPVVLFGLAVLAVASILGIAGRRGAFVAYFRSNTGTVLLYEAIFTGAFALFWVIRSLNPDLWHTSFGGEKPMEFAYLNAIAKSTYFPPFDPWFAGGYINYYYFGYVMVASLIRLTGIVPAVAFNLAIPTLFALTASGLFGLGLNWWLSRRPVDSWRPSRCPYIAGAAVVVFVLIVGNLDGLVQILQSLWKMSVFQAKSVLPMVGGLVQLVGGLWGMVSSGRVMPPFDFWRSTRVIGPEEVPPITEFPFFTFLYGDLHPHMMAMPLAALALLLALSIAWQGQKKSPGGDATIGDRVLAVGVAGLLLGALQTTNSWDYPTYLVLTAAAFVVASVSRAGRLTWAGSIEAAVSTAGTFAIATLLFLPFTRSYELFYAGVDPAKGRTSIPNYLLIMGFFLFCIFSLVFIDIIRNRWHRYWLRGAFEQIRAPRRAARRRGLKSRLVRESPWVEVLPSLIVFFVATAAVAMVFRHYLIALQVVLGLLVLLSMYRRDTSPERALFALFAGLGLALTLGVEIVTIKGDVGRMNTVFKFYLQAWFLLGTAAAIASVSLLSWWSRRSRGRWSGGGTAWVALFALMLGSVLIYPLAATPVKVGLRLDETAPTLDGMAYMKDAVFKDQNREIVLSRDYAAIQWIQDRVAGSPVVLEAQIPEYRWGSRVSVYTGLPTVLGWAWHQRQQRWGYQTMVDERARDVRTMFESLDESQVMALLQKYGVRLVYVGDLERAYYPAAGLAKFDGMVGNGLTVAYQSGGVVIYEVASPGRPSVVMAASEAPTGGG